MPINRWELQFILGSSSRAALGTCGAGTRRIGGRWPRVPRARWRLVYWRRAPVAARVVVQGNHGPLVGAGPGVARRGLAPWGEHPIGTCVAVGREPGRWCGPVRSLEPAPENLALEAVRLWMPRWRIEQGRPQMKEELGLGHFEGRRACNFFCVRSAGPSFAGQVACGGGRRPSNTMAKWLSAAFRPTVGTVHFFDASWIARYTRSNARRSGMASGCA
ncbi:unnamed protein product [Gemmata massiliana]|uniref:Uncharacterized protein n=1 Tax=Gemmata massiliana TaxID=1210884 RepID=A0A6P2DI93_9BACT|nr:unnamed protein product [Gemmata massiliana]